MCTAVSARERDLEGDLVTQGGTDGGVNESELRAVQEIVHEILLGEEALGGRPARSAWWVMQENQRAMSHKNKQKKHKNNFFYAAHARGSFRRGGAKTEHLSN